MQRYDSAITTFSPSGQLLQVDNAMEAVNKGMCCVGVKGHDCVVLGVEKKELNRLQDPRTVQKISQLDENIVVAFSGLNADARILCNLARLECQSYRLSYEDAPAIDYISRHISSSMQKYTQKGGVRPYGISMFVAGVGKDNVPHLYQTDPSGVHTEWYASAIGRNNKNVLEFLEKTYEKDMSRENCLKITCEALGRVAESGSRNIELVVITRDKVEYLPAEDIDAVVASLAK